MEDVPSYIVIVVSIVVIVAYLISVRQKSRPVASPVDSPVDNPVNKRAKPHKFNVEQLEQRIRRRLKENN
jgi:hypothetical protein